MTHHSQTASRSRFIRAGLGVALAALSACTSAAARDTALPANGCPVAAWSWVRWNDAYGLNVVGMIQSYPGWMYAFAPQAEASGGTTEESSIKLVLLPRRARPSEMPKTSDQHVYGYWPHAALGAKPNWVEIRCGTLSFGRFRTTPRDLFHPEPPEPPPTFPPPPPPKG